VNQASRNSLSTLDKGIHYSRFYDMWRSQQLRITKDGQSDSVQSQRPISIPKAIPCKTDSLFDANTRLKCKVI
jgi:hypothetical protein